MGAKVGDLVFELQIDPRSAIATVQRFVTKFRSAAQSIAQAMDIEVDTSDLEALDRELDDVTESADKAGTGTKSFGQKLHDLRFKILGVVAVATVLARGFASLAGSAGDLIEIQSKFDAVFQSEAEAARTWAHQYGDAVGRSRGDMEKWLSTLQDTFVPLGFARDKAADLSKQLVTLGIDMASFSNEADTETIESLQSAIVGNHETVRKYGIIITEATLKTTALSAGIIETERALTDEEKVLTRLKIIFDSTADAQGDAVRTADSYNNRVKAMEGSIQNLKGAMVILLPFASAVVDTVAAMATSAADFLAVPMSQKLREEQIEFNALMGVLRMANSLQSTRNKAIQTLQDKYPSYLGNLDLEKATIEDIATAQEEANKQFTQRIIQRAAEETLAEASKALIDARLKAYEATVKYNEAVNKMGEAHEFVTRTMRGESYPFDVTKANLRDATTLMNHYNKAAEEEQAKINELSAALYAQGLITEDLLNQTDDLVTGSQDRGKAAEDEKGKVDELAKSYKALAGISSPWKTSFKEDIQKEMVKGVEGFSDYAVLIGDAGDALLERRKAQIQSELDAQIQATLDGLGSAEYKAAKIEVLQEQARQKEKDAAKWTAGLQILQAIANTALAMTKYLWNPWAMALIALAGAAQVGTIVAQNKKISAMAAGSGPIDQPLLALLGEDPRSGSEIVVPETSFRQWVEQTINPELILGGAAAGGADFGPTNRILESMLTEIVALRRDQATTIAMFAQPDSAFKRQLNRVAEEMARSRSTSIMVKGINA